MQSAAVAAPVAAVRALQRCAADCSCCDRRDEDATEPLGLLLRAAVSARTLARTPATVAPPSTGLSALRFRGEPLLEACYADKARMGVGTRDTEDTKPVSKVQQALTDLELDLGAVDGIYGRKTAAAVREFKTREQLGFTQYGDVGPGTMHRLDELFAEPLPRCELPDDGTVTDAKALHGGAAALSAPLLGFVIPGLTCQLKAPPAIASLVDVPARVRAQIEVATFSTSQSEVDDGYQLYKGGLKQTGNIAQTAIFGAGIPADQDTRDGLVGVASKLNGGKPPFATNQTITVRVNDVPGDPKRKPRPTIPGGVFRFTRFTLPGETDEKMLIERLGDVKPSPTGVSDQQAFENKYMTFGYTIGSTMSSEELALLDQALARVSDTAKTKASGITFSRALKPPAGEAGHYDPNTNAITIFDAAFNPTATSPGGFRLSQFTIAHEIGHALSALDKTPKPGGRAAFDAAAAKDGMRLAGGTVSNAITQYGQTSLEENFAECFAVFVMDPGELRALRPNAAAALAARY